MTALVNEKLMEGQKSFLDVVLAWNFLGELLIGKYQILLLAVLFFFVFVF